MTVRARWAYASAVIAVTLFASTWRLSTIAQRLGDQEGPGSPRVVVTPESDPAAIGSSTRRVREVTVRSDLRDRLGYVRIPSGSFQMGCVPGDSSCSPDEHPRHSVVIANDVWMTRTEVTVNAFVRFAKVEDYTVPPPPPFNPGWRLRDHPMTNVKPRDAAAYCAWVAGRLPTEAEWEYAARGGSKATRFPWGDHTGDGRHANYRGTGGVDRWEQTAPVGSFDANGFGLFDMAGNVSEWVQDEWHADYRAAPSDGRSWGNPRTTSPKGSARVLRGGSWSYGERQLRSSYRSRWFWPGNRFDDYGFRCVVPVR